MLLIKISISIIDITIQKIKVFLFTIFITEPNAKYVKIKYAIFLFQISLFTWKI